MFLTTPLAAVMVPSFAWAVTQGCEVCLVYLGVPVWMCLSFTLFECVGCTQHKECDSEGMCGVRASLAPCVSVGGYWKGMCAYLLGCGPAVCVCVIAMASTGLSGLLVLLLESCVSKLSSRHRAVGPADTRVCVGVVWHLAFVACVPLHACVCVSSTHLLVLSVCVCQ